MPAKKKPRNPAKPVPENPIREEELNLVEEVLKDAIEKQKTGYDALPAARVTLVRVFGRILRMQEEIDFAYGGQLFDLRMSAMAPANIRRAYSYMEAHRRTTKLLYRAIDAWVLCAGVRWECDSRTCAMSNCPLRGKRPVRRTSHASS